MPTSFRLEKCASAVRMRRSTVKIDEPPTHIFSQKLLVLMYKPYV